MIRRSFPWLTVLLAVIAATGLWLRVRRHTDVRTAAPQLHGEPNLMLWAWETPEDLRTLDARAAGVAFLSRELLLGAHPQIRMRHQPLLLAPGTYLMAVVRIETASPFDTRAADIPTLAQQIVAAINAPNVRALQVDFDARASERSFYAALLREVRRTLPSGIPLSITALTSWCAQPGWLHTLPVDEAVPMFFRMGGPADTRALTSRSFAGIQEPLCTGSAGVATDEVWPALDSRQRVYVFRPDSWRAQDLALINGGLYPQLQTPPLRSSTAP